MTTLPLTINPNSCSMARFNFNDELSVLANAINRSLPRNVLQQEDFIISLPKSADLNSALRLNCNVNFAISFAFRKNENTRVESAPFRVFTRNSTTIKSIYNAFNQSWMDWQKERKEGDLLVGGYMRQNNIEKIQDPFKIVLNCLVDHIAPIHCPMQLSSLLNLTNKHGIVVSDHYTIPIAFCIVCLFDSSYYGCPLNLLTEEDALQHAESPNHGQEFDYHCFLLNSQNATCGTEQENEYINESTGNDESSDNMISDEEINDNSNSPSIN